jgi:hypothetical protein
MQLARGGRRCRSRSGYGEAGFPAAPAVPTGGVERRQQRGAGGRADGAGLLDAGGRAGDRRARRLRLADDAVRAVDRRPGPTSGSVRRGASRAAASPASGRRRDGGLGSGAAAGRPAHPASTRVPRNAVASRVVIGRGSAGGDAGSAAGAVRSAPSAAGSKAGALSRRRGECIAPAGPGFFGLVTPTEGVSAASGVGMNRKIAASRLRIGTREAGDGSRRPRHRVRLQDVVAARGALPRLALQGAARRSSPDTRSS